jgi:predicted transcriptional regulator
LKQQLASGKTIKDIAAAKGVDENTFRNNLVNAVKPDLDAKVAAGKLTQQQEDAILNKLKTAPLPRWDKTK